MRSGFRCWGIQHRAGVPRSWADGADTVKNHFIFSPSERVFFCVAWFGTGLTKTTSYEVILKGEVGWHHGEKSQIHVYLDETPSRCPKFGGNRTLGVFQAISKFQVQMERLVDELGAPRAAW